MVKAPILENQMKQPRPKKEMHELTPPAFQMPWVGLPITIGGPRWGRQMYGTSSAMYLAMLRFQLPLP